MNYHLIKVYGTCIHIQGSHNLSLTKICGVSKFPSPCGLQQCTCGLVSVVDGQFYLHETNHLCTLSATRVTTPYGFPM